MKIVIYGIFWESWQKKLYFKGVPCNKKVKSLWLGGEVKLSFMNFTCLVQVQSTVWKCRLNYLARHREEL